MVHIGNYFVADWKEKLLEDIDPSELPQHWGGTATDPDGDPHCRSKVRCHVLYYSVRYITVVVQLLSLMATPTVDLR